MPIQRSRGRSASGEAKALMQERASRMLGLSGVPSPLRVDSYRKTRVSDISEKDQLSQPGGKSREERLRAVFRTFDAAHKGEIAARDLSRVGRAWSRRVQSGSSLSAARSASAWSEHQNKELQTILGEDPIQVGSETVCASHSLLHLSLSLQLGPFVQSCSDLFPEDPSLFDVLCTFFEEVNSVSQTKHPRLSEMHNSL